MTLHTLRTRLAAGTLSTLVLTLVPVQTDAQGSQVLLELRPHCLSIEADNTFGGPTPDVDAMTEPLDEESIPCTNFPIRDPLSRQTPQLREGDVLDIDLVAINPNREPISRVRAFIQYDPSILEGEGITLMDAFPVSAPGELDFDPVSGTIRIGVASDTPTTAEEIPVVNLRMRILSTQAAVTMITFQENTGGIDSVTGVFATESGAEQNVLSPTLGALAVRLTSEAHNAAESSASSETSASTQVSQQASSEASTEVSSSQQPSEASSSSEEASSESMNSSSAPRTSAVNADGSAFSAVPLPTAFPDLQIQNLRVTTEGSTVFLAWDALPSADLRAYTVYYGTVSGRYIQKRTIAKDHASLTLRSLPNGTTYYFAVRGSDGSIETQFSREVAVTVGEPLTSTSPLTASALDKGPGGVAPGTNGSVSGSTGSSSMLLLVIALSALSGIALALRRQLRPVVTHV